MIGQLCGVLIEKQAPSLLLEVQGVGYEVDSPLSTFYQLPDIGEKVSLFTHFVVREDAHQLYGFVTRDERHLFRTLLKVNGVGPRLALAILSSVSPQEFIRCILNNDTVALIALPGIGKKTAERLIIEMRDRLSEQIKTTQSQVSAENTRYQVLQDAISALMALGYKQQEASRLVTKVDDGKLSSEELIRIALREMM